MPQAAYTPEIEHILHTLAEEYASFYEASVTSTQLEIAEVFFTVLREGFRRTLPRVLEYAAPSARGPRG